MDEEDARDEEKEAQRLQRARAELLQDDDFDLGVTVGDAVDASSSKKDKKKKKKDKKRGKKHTKGGMTNMAALEVVEKVARNVSDMTEDEKLQIVISDSPELLGLLEEFKKCVLRPTHCVSNVSWKPGVFLWRLLSVCVRTMFSHGDWGVLAEPPWIRVAPGM